MFDPNRFYDLFGIGAEARQPPHLFQMDEMDLWIETEKDASGASSAGGASGAGSAGGGAIALHIAVSAGGAGGTAGARESGLADLMAETARLSKALDVFLSRAADQRLWIHIPSPSGMDESREILALFEAILPLLRQSGR